MKKLTAVLLALCITLAPAGALAVGAESYIVTDADSGRVLYEQNADERMLIASTTKIMTALVALEHGSTNDIVTVTEEAAGVEGSSMGLTAGDRLRLEELLYGMMLVSGNDAAAAVACHIAGSSEKFAELMNAKAAELGMTGSSFSNPHGLDDANHYSTARDMAILMRAALDNEVLAAILATKTVTINGVTYKNHNKLLWMYDGVIGGKTGYTTAAGRTLVSCCERGGVRLICVTLNDPQDWDDHMALYDRAFGEYKPVTVVDASSESWEVPVTGCAGTDKVRVVPRGDVRVMMLSDDKAEITVELPGFVYAGFDAGDTVGSLTVKVNGVTVCTDTIVYAESTEREQPKGNAILEGLKKIVEKYLHSFDLGTQEND